MNLLASARIAFVISLLFTFTVGCSTDPSFYLKRTDSETKPERTLEAENNTIQSSDVKASVLENKDLEGTEKPDGTKQVDGNDTSIEGTGVADSIEGAILTTDTAGSTGENKDPSTTETGEAEGRAGDPGSVVDGGTTTTATTTSTTTTVQSQTPDDYIPEDGATTPPAPMSQMQLKNVCAVDAKKEGKQPFSFYLNGIGHEKYLALGKLRFVENIDGTARLTGTIVDYKNDQKRFKVDVLFTVRKMLPPVGSPKLELPPEAYIQEDGNIDPALWYYYETTSGTLTGEGKFEGAELVITRKGPAFQMGFGANGKNENDGASGWFHFITTKQPKSRHHKFCKCGWGDINIDFVPCDDAPKDLAFSEIKECHDLVFNQILLGVIDFNNAIAPFNQCLALKQISCSLNQEVFQIVNTCVMGVNPGGNDTDQLIEFQTCLANNGLNQCSVIQ